MPNSNQNCDQSPCHLADILGVRANIERNCAGFATTTKDGRCKLPGSDKHIRPQASILLDEGTRLLQSGQENIDDLLKRVAPLLLCNRRHQKDAPRLVRDWSIKVAEFNEKRSASTRFLLPSPSPVSETERTREYSDLQLAQTTGRASSPRRASRTPVEETVDNPRSENIRPTRVTSAPPSLDTVRQPSTSTDTTPTTSPTMDQRRSSTPVLTSIPIRLPALDDRALENLHALSSVLIERLEGNALLERRVEVYQQVTSERGSTIRQSGHIAVNFSRQFQNAGSTISTYESRTQLPALEDTESRPSNENSTPRVTTAGSTRRQTLGGRTSTSASRERIGQQTSFRRGEVSRKHVEGDCHICFLPLLDESSEEEEEEEEQPETDDAYESEDDVESSEEYELVWCKRQCGYNFHRSCVDSWIESCSSNGQPATCPMCRARWASQ